MSAKRIIPQRRPADVFTSIAYEECIGTFRIDFPAFNPRSVSADIAEVEIVEILRKDKPGQAALSAIVAAKQKCCIEFPITSQVASQTGRNSIAIGFDLYRPWVG